MCLKNRITPPKKDYTGESSRIGNLAKRTLKICIQSERPLPKERPRENINVEGNPITPKTDSSSCFGISK